MVKVSACVRIRVRVSVRIRQKKPEALEFFVIGPG